MQTVFLSGEIHTDWRDEIIEGCQDLDYVFTSAVLNHSASDDCGPAILGHEDDKFWYDRKSARMNAIRISNAIKSADIVIVLFGEKYKQWNAAFDAGFAVALGKPLIVIHQDEHGHALKEIDAAAHVVCKTPKQAIQTLRYLQTSELSAS
ncbi:MAG: YtoQ family protein [Pseudomonadota bacterium]